jgi:hypothetical protein
LERLKSGWVGVKFQIFKVRPVKFHRTTYLPEGGVKVQVKNLQHGQITHEGEAGQISSNYLPSRGGGLKCK